MMSTLLEKVRVERKRAEAFEKFLFEQLNSSGLQFDATVQLSEGWFEARKTKITASNFGTICNVGRTLTARSLWDIMTGRVEKSNIENEHTQRGRVNESRAIDLYQAIFRVTVEQVGLYALKPPLDFLGASPDGLLCD